MTTPTNRILVAGVLGIMRDYHAEEQITKAQEREQLNNGKGRPQEREQPNNGNGKQQPSDHSQRAKPNPKQPQVVVEVATVRSFTPLGGQVTRLTLQVATPYGDPFQLQLTVGVGVTGIELLKEPDSIGRSFVIEGALVFARRFDSRFADPRKPLDRGMETRELRLHVRSVRPATPDEAASASAVWLSGVVTEPPRIFRHPDYPGQLLAATYLEVQSNGFANAFGGRALAVSTTSIPVMVPVAAEGAGYLFRVGNVVQVEGMLDCQFGQRGGKQVRAALAALDADWTARQAAFAPDAIKEWHTQGRAYAKQRRKLAEAAQRSVLIGAITPLSGEPLAIEEIEAARDAYLEARKAERSQQHAAKRARTKRASAGETARADDTEPAPPLMESGTQPDDGRPPLVQSTRRAPAAHRQPTADFAEAAIPEADATAPSAVIAADFAEAAVPVADLTALSNAIAAELDTPNPAVSDEQPFYLSNPTL